jgi:hypothetical protein
VKAHLLQELRGLEAAAVHLSGRARISSAEWNWGRRIVGQWKGDAEGVELVRFCWEAELREGEGK